LFRGVTRSINGSVFLTLGRIRSKGSLSLILTATAATTTTATTSSSTTTTTTATTT